MDSFAPILVLGLGNDILTDDAVGLHVVDVVRQALAHLSLVEVKATTEMGLALLDEIAGRAGVIIVDSVQTGKAAAGHIHDLGLGDLSAVLTTSPHFLGVRETLALGAMVGLQMPQSVRIVAIEVADPFTLGQEMTPAVAAAVPLATELVVRRAREMAAAVSQP